MKLALVCGAGIFIGSHMVKRLKAEGFWVRGIDLKYPGFSETEADDFIIGDLRNPTKCQQAVNRKFDEMYSSRGTWVEPDTCLPMRMTRTLSPNRS